jgi:hypothetical protein
MFALVNTRQATPPRHIFVLLCLHCLHPFSIDDFIESRDEGKSNAEWMMMSLAMTI